MSFFSELELCDVLETKTTASVSDGIGNEDLEITFGTRSSK